MTPVRYAALLLALPAMTALEAFGYYAVRSMLPMIVRDMAPAGGLGMSTAELGQSLTILAVMMGLSPLLGGLIAIATGPRITLVAGALLGAVTYVGLAATSRELLLLWFALWALACGLYRPSFLAVAGLELSRAREGLRLAPFVLLYGASNIAALLATVATSQTRGLGSARSMVCGGAAVAMVLVAGGALALALLRHKAKHHSTGGRLEIGLLLLALGLGPALAAIAFTFDLLLREAAGLGFATTTTLHTINPLVVIAVSAAAAVGLLILGAVKIRPPTMILLGVGALVIGAGAAPLLLSGSPAPPLTLYGTAAILGFGEVLVLALGAARMATGTHPRFAVLILAVWFATSRGLHVLASVAAEASWSRALLALSAIGCLIAGGLLLGLGKHLQQRCFEHAEPDASPAPPPGPLPGGSAGP